MSRLLRPALPPRRHRRLPGPLQAPGRRLDQANGSTLIGQNWSSPRFFHGRPDDIGPYAGTGDNPLVANGKNGASGPTNLGPRSRRCSPTPRPSSPIGTRWASTRRRTWSPRPEAGSTPTSPRPTPTPRYLWCPRPQDCPRRRWTSSSPGRQSRRARFPRLELHRRPPVERGPRQDGVTVCHRPAGWAASALRFAPRKPLASSQDRRMGMRVVGQWGPNGE